MATKRIWNDAYITCGGVNITDNANSISFEPQLETPESTTYGDSGVRNYEAGLESVSATVNGYLPDASAQPHLAMRSSTELPVVACDDATPEDGDLAMVINMVRSTFTESAAIGDVVGFTLGGSGQGDWGYILGARSAITTSSNGTEVGAGAIATGSKALAILAVHSGDTGTLDVLVESDTTGFPSATTRATFSQVAAASAPDFQVIEISGAVTDTFWRDNYTVTGGGTWAFTVAIVIL